MSDMLAKSEIIGRIYFEICFTNEIAIQLFKKFNFRTLERCNEKSNYHEVDEFGMVLSS